MTSVQTQQRNQEYDPDEYRMTVGEHLEELRRRMILGLAGLLVAFVFCLVFADRVMALFCLPLIEVLRARELNPQLFFTQVTDPFMVYIKISLITAAAIASPWILYQLWKFVASGLYPHERRWVTRYLPLSITLLVLGMLLVYFIVLPFALRFLIDFGTALRLPEVMTPAPAIVEPAPVEVLRFPVYAGDPADPQPGQVWFNSLEGRMKVQFPDGVRVQAFVSENLVAPLPTLPEYINLVVLLLLVFGLCFQLPLVVMALVRMGIVEIDAMKQARRYIYFGLAVLSAVVTPADVISMVALMIPMMLLYEFGLFMAQRGQAKVVQ